MTKKFTFLFLLFMFVSPMGLANESIQGTDKLFSRFTVHGSPGCALGVLQDGKVRYTKGYGMANLEHQISIEADRTVFDIGSASKQFTAAAILMLIEEGKLSLDDDIRKFFPDLNVRIPQIRVKHLLVHTSGLRDYAALMDLQGFFPEDYSTPNDAIRVITNQIDLEFTPGERHAYSNTNYFLLGQIVAKVTGKSLAQFTQERIFLPLGMVHTLIRDNHMQTIAHRASAYDDLGSGEYAIDMGNGTITGDGLVHTTVADLAKWDENFYTHQVGGASLHQQMLTPGRLNDGTPLHYALGGLYLETYRGQNTVYHRGASTGYRTQLLRFPNQHFSVITLCNVDNSRPAVLSEAVADLWLSNHLNPKEIESNPLSAVPKAERFVGMYWSKEDASISRLSKDNDKLWYTDRFNAKIEVGQDMHGNFILKDKIPRTQLKFVIAPDGKIEGLAVSGRVIGGSGEFVNFEPKLAVKPSVDELHEYAGTFKSAELGVSWTIKVQNNKLVLSFFRNPNKVLTPLFADAFRGVGMIRFERDAQNKITSLVVDYNWLRNLRFYRENFR